MPVSPTSNIACIFWSHITEGHDWTRQDAKTSVRGISRQGPAKTDWDSSGQQEDDKTLISTKRHQISLATAYSKQKLVGFDTIKLWNVLSWCITNSTVSWLQCLSLAWELKCSTLSFCLAPLIPSASGPAELPGWPSAWSYSQFYWNITYFQFLWTDSFPASKWFDQPDNGSP